MDHRKPRPGVKPPRVSLPHARATAKKPPLRPQVTTLGREAYPSFPDKVAAFVFALLSYRPFHGGNKRLALASIFAFCELNNKTIDSRVLDEKTAENLVKRAAGHRELGIPPENVFREFREAMTRAIVIAQP